MVHAIALVLSLIWVACNFYLWSMKQEHLTLFWESLGTGAVAIVALFWYVTHPAK